MARHALLIGVSEFADERLARLNAPTNDVIALRGILQDSSRGNFDSVELSLNEDFLRLRDQFSTFFDNRSPDDLLLLYYSAWNPRPWQPTLFGHQHLQPRYPADPQYFSGGTSSVHRR